MRRIAVVEDNPDNQLLVEAILEDDYQLDQYDNGVEAVAGITARPPDLVLLDISLPGMDGVAVLARLRETAGLETLPVVALTAHAMAGDRKRFLAHGFDGYVSKPITDEDVLLGTIESLLSEA